MIKELQKKYFFYIWEKVDDNNSAIRLVTSWGTQEIKVRDFIDDLKKLLQPNNEKVQKYFLNNKVGNLHMMGVLFYVYAGKHKIS